MCKAPSTVHTVTAQANAIGREFGVRCSYVPEKSAFVWLFYRGQQRLGRTKVQSAVVGKMKRFCGVKV